MEFKQHISQNVTNKNFLWMKVYDLGTIKQNYTRIIAVPTYDGVDITFIRESTPSFFRRFLRLWSAI